MSAPALSRRAVARAGRAQLIATPPLSALRRSPHPHGHCPSSLSAIKPRSTPFLLHSAFLHTISTYAPSNPFSSTSPSTSSTPSSSSSKRPGPPPTLNATLRRFYFLVHPDLFHSHPHHRAVNEANLQHFIGFITAMKQTNSSEPWPHAQHTNLTFYVRRKRGDGVNTGVSFVEWSEAKEAEAKKGGRGGKGGGGKGKVGAVGGGVGSVDGEFHVLRLTLSTNGGNCKGVVERQLRHLFHMMGLPEEFVWDDEYWKTKPRIERKDDEQQEEDEEEAYA